MPINNTKTQALLTGPCKYNYDLAIKSSVIETLPTILKVLGVELDSMLSFKETFVNSFTKYTPKVALSDELGVLCLAM